MTECLVSCILILMNKRLYYLFVALIAAGFMMLFSSFRDNDRIDLVGINQLNATKHTSTQLPKPGFKIDRSKTAVHKDFLNPVIAPQKGGLLRGIYLGMTRDDVKRMEPSTLLDEQDLKLVYQISTNELGVTVQVTYDFSYEHTLNLITVDVFADREEDAALAKKAYETYFNKVFGPYQLDPSGYMNWKAQNPLPYSVFLKEVSMPGDAGLTLQFVAL